MQFVIQFLARMQGQILQPQRRQSRGGRQLKDQVLAIKLKGHRGEHARVDELLRVAIHLRITEHCARRQAHRAQQLLIRVVRRPCESNGLWLKILANDRQRCKDERECCQGKGRGAWHLVPSLTKRKCNRVKIRKSARDQSKVEAPSNWDSLRSPYIPT